MNNKELQGVMFPNDKTGEKSPDLRGSALIGGVEYYVAGWKRISKAGGKYLSLAFQRKDEKPAKKPAPHTPQETVNQVAKAVGGSTELVQEQTYTEDVPF